ncbi:response regulator transcription factor [Roseobacter sp. A03A-229]
MAKILVLEDDTEFADLLVVSLEGDNHSVEVCNTTADALNALKTARFDLIVSDVFIRADGKLSEKGGISLVSRVKQTSPNPIPVIAISGSFDDGQGKIFKSSLKTVGADAVLAKPFHPEQLLDLVFELTNRE